jgi:hypothetical protein
MSGEKNLVAGLLFTMLLAPVGADEARWARVDQAALKAPKKAEANLGALTKYLSRCGNNPEERARAAYRWICDRLVYDVEGFRKGDAPQDGVTALRRRKATCAGYSDLYVILLKDMGIDAVQVPGQSKGYGFEANAPLNKNQRHAWVAFRNGARWELVDPTWGAGSLAAGDVFTKRFSDYWFETPPSQMIYSHFPEDSRWQQLSPKWGQRKFAEAVRVTQYFFKYGVKPVRLSTGAPADQMNLTTDSSGELILELDGPPSLRVSATIDEGPAGSTLVNRRGGHQTVMLRAGSGNSRLRLFGTTDSQGGTTARERKLDWMMEYRIYASRGSKEAFPHTFGDYSEHQAQLVSPLVGQLKSGRSYKFDVNLAGAKEVRVGPRGVPNKMVPLTQKGDHFVGSAKFSQQDKQVVIFALYPGDNRYWGLVDYPVVP